MRKSWTASLTTAWLLSISAGNEYSAALGTRIGKGHALTANPDYGTVASPSSYSGPLSVASVEKADTIDSCYLTVGDRKVAFNDTAEDTTGQRSGQQLSELPLPGGYGTELCRCAQRGRGQGLRRPGREW